jgi:hypothetical protein
MVRTGAAVRREPSGAASGSGAHEPWLPGHGAVPQRRLAPPRRPSRWLFDRWSPAVPGLLLLPALSFAQTLTVDGSNSPVVVAAPASYGAVTVSDGGVLLVNAPLTVTGDMRVGRGGLVTMDAGVYVLRLDVGGTLSVELGSRIDVAELGLPAGATIDPVTGDAVASRGGGGSHCALGGRAWSESAYDDPFDPRLPGAGPGWDPPGFTLRGGGALLVRAAALRLDGVLRAWGSDGRNSHAGAGGAVNVEVQEFSGGGTISAAGGSSAYEAGGAGGCVRVAFQRSSFTGTCDVGGGRSDVQDSSGATGSALLVDRAADVPTVAHGELSLRGGQRLRALAIAPNALLRIVGEAEVAVPIAVPLGARVVVESRVGLKSLRLGPVIAGAVEVDTDAASSIGWTLTGRLIVNRRLTLPSLDAEAGAVITHGAGIWTMHLDVPGRLRIAAGARADAVGLGLPIERSFDPVTLVERFGASGGSGGSHGGLGGRATNPRAFVAPVYDDPAAPALPGGGGASNENFRGGPGGGVLRLSAGLLELDGSLVADGAGFPGLNVDGAGAGGSIVVRAGTLGGSGAILARGHQVPTEVSNGGGGGGLVLLTYGSKRFAGAASAAGGPGNGPGQDGFVTEVVAPMAPSIVSEPPASASPGRPLTHVPRAAGTEPFTWALPAGPAGATVDAVSGALHWVPTEEGTADFELTVANAQGEARQAFRVLVHDAGAAGTGGDVGPPRFVSTPDTAARCGVPYRYSGVRLPTVAGAGPLAFSIGPALGIPLPAGLRVDAATGEFDWTPVPAEVGVHPLELRVDGPEGTTRQTFAVVVECGSGRLSVGCGCAAPTGTPPFGQLGGLMVAAGLIALVVARRRRRATSARH